MAQGDVTNMENDTWVRVKGIIDTVQYNGGKIPVLRITSIVLISDPQQPYVYNIEVLLGG